MNGIVETAAAVARSKRIPAKKQYSQSEKLVSLNMVQYSNEKTMRCKTKRSNQNKMILQK